ncbi:BTAD domain-containing putative transcriptional regulator [Devosia sp. SL43]|uniref:BTAD domain-containing putative transcriptional regulator n=1 Tax=Devosia sp. SL43 TaxID=2806348 RepID=UPI001F386E3A|nr:BTAD domain-containing putative transcriptional regulator [Devosia sp. SL43]UJW86509.1 transcriptional regulator [Devosia sp. SL43]
MKSAASEHDNHCKGIAITMLGPLAVWRDGRAVALPASRKARALLAYLALAPRPVSRSYLCELLWDVPSDPRGELRWCLSKLRALLNEPGSERVCTEDDHVWLALTDCQIDIASLEAALAAPAASMPYPELSALWRGQFLDGLTLDRSPVFQAWVTAQRRRSLGNYLALLQLAVSSCTDPASRLVLIERWIELSPYDERPHVLLLSILRQAGQISAAETHLRNTIDLFRSEGLDTAGLRSAGDRVKGTERVPATLAIADPSEAAAEPLLPRHRASLAIMPFVEQTEQGSRGGLADALTQDIITRLARMRTLFVIARGSVYALTESGQGALEAARKLKVDYVTSGTCKVSDSGLSLGIELIEVRSGRIVWSEQFERSAAHAITLLDELGDQIVAAIASEIETVERNLAVLKPASSLNAWEAYHRGLWHMYRFTKDENGLAQRFFQHSVDLDPTFARAHAGLSFTHWQSAFQHWGDKGRDRDLAYATAGQGLIADDRDPSAHWAMGRALWMRGDVDQSLVELEQAVDLSPNFALGHYALSFVQSQSGDPQAAIAAADHSRNLSPFDPLLFGMLGARAMAHVRLGQFEEAADWAMKAAARPNAHATIMAIAAHCLALVGRVEEARTMMAAIRVAVPRYGIADFLDTFRFAPESEAHFRHAARLIESGSTIRY